MPPHELPRSRPDRARKRAVRARMADAREPYSVAARRVAADRGDLHVTNGDSTVEVLRAARVTEPILPWRDVLHDGPVPGGVGVGIAELREVRAGFIASAGWGDRRAVLQDFQARDATLARARDGSYVLWFEADLYDQLQLVQILARLRTLGVGSDRITLVSAGEFPGIAHFGGLGQLDPEQLLTLREQAVRLDDTDLAHGTRAWRAFTSPVPSELSGISRLQSPRLRFVGEAFARLLREYPAVSDGLSLLQRRILLAVEAGAASAGEVFAEVSRREQRPYLGDWSCWARIRELAGGRQPLLACEDGSAEFANRGVRLTADGQAVLAGDADHVRLNGIDRWIGGVHLEGAEAAWRFDDRRETLVRSV